MLKFWMLDEGLDVGMGRRRRVGWRWGWGLGGLGMSVSSVNYGTLHGIV